MMKLYLFAPTTKHISGNQCKVVVFIGLPVGRISFDVPEAGAICCIVQYFWAFVVHSGDREISDVLNDSYSIKYFSTCEEVKSFKLKICSNKSTNYMEQFPKFIT
jgi:hypothetical protein